MTSGGAQTTAAIQNPATLAIQRAESEPPYETIEILHAEVELLADERLLVKWEVDATTAPPFAYHIKAFDGQSESGKPLIELSRRVPHARSATVDISELKIPIDRCRVHLECVDIPDRPSATKVLAEVVDRSGVKKRSTTSRRSQSGSASSSGRSKCELRNGLTRWMRADCNP